MTWFLLAIGLACLAFGLAILLGITRPIPYLSGRRDGWSTVAWGIGAVLWAVALGRGAAGRDLGDIIWWTGTACVAVGVALEMLALARSTSASVKSDDR